MVVDASTVLTVYFAEPHATWAAKQLADHAPKLVMSTVNLTEVLIKIRDRQPTLADALEARLFASGIRFVAPDPAQARIAAAARLRYPLNLGDCFAYALAVAESCPILTTDNDFKCVDQPVLLPPA